jgi:predicted transcriptional regulator
MAMIAVRLPEEIERRLAELAAGRAARKRSMFAQPSSNTSMRWKNDTSPSTG